MSDRFSVGEVTAWFFPNIGFVNWGFGMIMRVIGSFI
jgi:hypothetical protein